MIKILIKKLLIVILLVVLGTLLYVNGFLVEAEEKQRGDLPSRVVIMTIDGEIKQGTVQYLRRAIRKAEQQKADYLVIKLHTPGGLLAATEDIITKIQATPIPVVVFVYREAGWGYSAGAFILLSAEIAVMHPLALVGAAQPAGLIGIQSQVSQLEPIAEPKPVQPPDKATEVVAEWIRSIAMIHDRNPEIAEKFVRENLVLTGQEALEKGVIDFVAQDLSVLWLELGISRPEIITVMPNFTERLFNFFSHPFIVPLFLLFGLLGIITAIQSREIEIGVIALIPFFLGIWGLGIIEFSFLSLFLILLGVVLLAVEIFTFAGFGALGIGGMVAILIGSIGFVTEPFLRPALYDALFITALIVTLGACLLFIIISRAVIRTLKLKPQTGIEALIGKTVVVVKELNPQGQVSHHGEIWQAESLDKKTIEKKREVKIIKIKGNKLYVSPT